MPWKIYEKTAGEPVKDNTFPRNNSRRDLSQDFISRSAALLNYRHQKCICFASASAWWSKTMRLHDFWCGGTTQVKFWKSHACQFPHCGSFPYFPLSLLACCLMAVKTKTCVLLTLPPMNSGGGGAMSLKQSLQSPMKNHRLASEVARTTWRYTP